MTVQTTIAVDELRAQVEGRVIRPEDPEYDEARDVFYGGIDRRPAAIVRVANDADVSRVVSFARDGGMDLAVRSGGHSIAGHSVIDGGIVLDVSDRKAIEVDPSARTAWAESGLTASEFVTRTAEHGLGIGFGDTGSVGIGGLTLGGGVGLLVRKYGLTIDDLLAADVVTADGELRRADEKTNQDLFWAIRGGGGNFGVATRFHFRLHEIRQIIGGFLFLPATVDTVARFIELSEAAPEELSTIANVMPAPPMPLVPEEQHGKLVIFGMIAWVGDIDAGQRALEPFRAIATPIADLLRPMSYPEIYPPEDESYKPFAVARTMLMNGFDHSAAETVMKYLSSSDASMRVAQIRVLGGAMARVPAKATAFAHRDSPIMVNVAAFYESEEERVRREGWVRQFAAALNDGNNGAYVNFLAEEGEERIRAAYPGSTWDRLRQIKAKYDPQNLFRINQNIPPAKG